MSLKGAFRELLGAKAYSRLQNLKNRATQKDTTLKIGRYDVHFPKGHILPLVAHQQPLRNLALGIAAGEISKKYPNRPILDIGANVGDTAALVATHSSVPLVLVEPSDVYFPFLEENTARLPNHTVLHKCFVFSGSKKARLVHEAGTAYLNTEAVGAEEIRGKQLADFGEPKLVKIDTDGFDFDIIAANLEFLARVKPALYFENTAYNQDNMIEANEIAACLAASNYVHFHVFTARGTHMCSTDDVNVVFDLNRFLCSTFTGIVSHNLYYYDILCFHNDDSDVSSSVASYFRSSNVRS